jgi:hypothetical protein
MSSVIIAGNTSGTITLDAPNVAGTTVLTLPTTNGTIVTTNTMPTGSVLQVVSATKTDTFSSSGSGFNAITGLSVSITPSSSSNKIMILVNTGFSSDGSNYDIMFALYKNSSVLSGATGDASSSRGRVTFSGANRVEYEINNGGMTYLDSPATTSSTTYDLRVKNQGTIYINRESNNNDNEWHARGISTITVMEIKG